MVNISDKTPQRQVTPFRNEELESQNLTPSRLRIQDSQREYTLNSNTTFDTFRAYGRQSGYLQYSQGEVGERLQRSPSIFALLSPPSRAPAELVCLLGDKDGKLKAGATLPSRDLTSHVTADNPTTPQSPVDIVAVERAKPRPRVGLNLRLDGDTFVEGQIISGRLVVHVGNADSPVRLANAKLRVIGFECLEDGPTFHVFFHYSCDFDEASYASEQIFSESPDYSDEEGYREARPGIHVLPFEMTLSEDSCFGKPKGALDVRGGVSVRYIIMASVDIKDPDTNQRSLSHFYRACSIWPSLSIHDVLVPSTRPLVSTAVMTLSKGSSRGKLKLSARVPRLSYLSGQPCYVHVQVLNETHKTVRALCLTLIRTTTVYRPQSGKGNRRDEHDHVSNKYQSKSFVDTISESRLAMVERTTRKCASSRGWWAGVGPQERTGFTHSILIPPDALSIARTEFLAVDHAIRVTIYASAGTIGLTSHLSVTLPIRVLSMLSVDPPTSVSRPPNMPMIAHAKGPDVINGLALHLQDSSFEHLTDSPPPYRTRPPSVEHPQDISEILPHYHPSPNAWSTASCDGSQMREHAFDEMSPIRAAIAQEQRSTQTIEARAPIMHVEEWSSHHPAVSGTRSPGATTRAGSQAGRSSGVSESSMSDDSRALSSISQLSPGDCNTSPTPSLCRARDRAWVITGFSRLGQAGLRGDVTNQDVQGNEHTNGDSKRDFRSYESPFSRRVKEKLRQVQAHTDESPRELGKRTAPSAKDAEHDCEREIREPLAHSQEQSDINASSVGRNAGLRRIKPLYVRRAQPRLLMGPRKLNMAPAPGSVLDRVRTIEGRNNDEMR